MKNILSRLLPFRDGQRKPRAKRRSRSGPLTRGTRRGLSLQRRLVIDLLHFARKAPSVPMQRRMRLSQLIAARRTWPQHVSWTAIFVKAYAIVSAGRPELRRSFMSFPWPHLYEHPGNIAMLTIERMYEGEPGVFMAQIPRAEIIKLEDLDAFVRHHKEAPIESIDSFRRGLWVSKFPLPVRRLMWWSAFNLDGLTKAKVFGTYGVSTVASLGAGSLHVLSPLTTTLNYGTFAGDGSLDVRLTYDHRVMDGAMVARALADLESVLHDEILPELKEGPVSKPATPIAPVLAPTFVTQGLARLSPR